jgi:hypothetical protein
VNVDVKKKWVAALRSGDYTQGHGCLRRDYKYCCLGVLCDVIDPGRWYGDSYMYGVERASAYLPNKLRENVSLSISHERILSQRNDLAQTFDEIAEYIEKNL